MWRFRSPHHSCGKLYCGLLNQSHTRIKGLLQRFPVTLSQVVIAGLDPAIHPFRKKMDARVKPGHDEL